MSRCVHTIDHEAVNQRVTVELVIHNQSTIGPQLAGRNGLTGHPIRVMINLAAMPDYAMIKRHLDRMFWRAFEARQQHRTRSDLHHARA